MQEARDKSVTHAVAHAYCSPELANMLISQVDPFPQRFSRLACDSQELLSLGHVTLA